MIAKKRSNKMQNVLVSMPEWLIADLTAESSAKDMSRNELIRDLLISRQGSLFADDTDVSPEIEIGRAVDVLQHVMQKLKE